MAIKIEPAPVYAAIVRFGAYGGTNARGWYYAARVVSVDGKLYEIDRLVADSVKSKSDMRAEVRAIEGDAATLLPDIYHHNGSRWLEPVA